MEKCYQIIKFCNDGLSPPFQAFCSNCNKEWGFTPKYCPECGAKVILNKNNTDVKNNSRLM